MDATLPLCIKLNKVFAENTCAICGTWWQGPEVGPAVYVEGTWEPLCPDCAKALAPALWAFCQGLRLDEVRDPDAPL